MEMTIIAAEYSLDIPDLCARLGLEEHSDEADDFRKLAETAEGVAKPKAAMGEAKVERADPDGSVVLDGIRFNSKLLAKNLRGKETVWPYFATCGRELYDWAQNVSDPFERYWAEEVMQQALTGARAAMIRHFERNVYQGKNSSMSPGSLQHWPIYEQKPLFDLFGTAPSLSGVTLTDSMLMLPNKSVSGICFPDENGFVSCQLCPRKNCPRRKAEYMPKTADLMSNL